MAFDVSTIKEYAEYIKEFIQTQLNNISTTFSEYSQYFSEYAEYFSNYIQATLFQAWTTFGEYAQYAKALISQGMEWASVQRAYLWQQLGVFADWVIATLEAGMKASQERLAYFIQQFPIWFNSITTWLTHAFWKGLDLAYDLGVALWNAGAWIVKNIPLFLAKLYEGFTEIMQQLAKMALEFLNILKEVLPKIGNAIWNAFTTVFDHVFNFAKNFIRYAIEKTVFAIGVIGGFINSAVSFVWQTVGTVIQSILQKMLMGVAFVYVASQFVVNAAASVLNFSLWQLTGLELPTWWILSPIKEAVTLGLTAVAVYKIAQWTYQGIFAGFNYLQERRNQIEIPAIVNHIAEVAHRIYPREDFGMENNGYVPQYNQKNAARDERHERRNANREGLENNDIELGLDLANRDVRPV